MEKVTITSNEVGAYPDMVLKILDSGFIRNSESQLFYHKTRDK